MADLGSKKISSNYHRLLQISESGVVADGAGNTVTLHISGSQTYLSGSGDENTRGIMSLGVTGSIIPQGSGSWDLGSEDSPFRDLYIVSESINFVNVHEPSLVLGQKNPLRITKLLQSDIDDMLKGDIQKKIGDDGKRLVTKVRPTITSKFTDVNISNDLDVGGTITGDGSGLTNVTPIDLIKSGVEPFVWDGERNLVSNNLTELHIVSDKFWLWDSELDELEPRSIMFKYAIDSSPTNDLVIGG